MYDLNFIGDVYTNKFTKNEELHFAACVINISTHAIIPKPKEDGSVGAAYHEVWVQDEGGEVLKNGRMYLTNLEFLLETCEGDLEEVIKMLQSGSPRLATVAIAKRKTDGSEYYPWTVSHLSANGDEKAESTFAAAFAARRKK